MGYVRVKRLSTLLTSFGLLAVALTTAAGASKWECGERSNLPIEGKNYCAASDFRQSEINLEKVLGDLLNKHIAIFGNANALSDAQTAFQTYRDSQCEVETRRIADKPYHPMIVAQCKTRLTNLRIDGLKRMKQ